MKIMIFFYLGKKAVYMMIIIKIENWARIKKLKVKKKYLIKK